MMWVSVLDNLKILEVYFPSTYIPYIYIYATTVWDDVISKQTYNRKNIYIYHIKQDYIYIFNVYMLYLHLS